MNKSLFAATILLATVLLGLGACAGTPTPVPPTAAPVQIEATRPAALTPAATPTAGATPTPSATPTSQDTRTNIYIWHGWSGAYLKVIEAALKEYEATHPDVAVELSKVDNLSDALAVAAPAGEGPDIIAWTNDQIGANALAGYIVSLESYGVNADFLVSLYEPAAAKGMIWRQQAWGLPETQEGIALIYNKALVSAEDLPADPLDFAGLLQSASTFAEQNPGKYLLCNQGLGNPDAYHIAPIFFGHGVPGYVDDQGTVYVQTAEGLAAAQWIESLRPYAPAEASYDICRTMMLDGQAAVWWTEQWATTSLDDAGIEYGLQAFGRPYVRVRTLLLSKNAVERGRGQAAFDIMRHLTNPDLQTRLALAAQTVPAATEALAASELQGESLLQGYAAALHLGVPIPNTPFAEAQWDAIGAAGLAIWTGKQTPAVALQAAQAAIVEKIRKMQ